MLLLLQRFLIKEYADSTHGSMGLPFSSSLEGGRLQQYLYSQKFFDKPYLFHLDTTLAAT